MADTRCPDDYLPWLLAWDYNLLPDDQAKHEADDLGDGDHQILLASHGHINSSVWIKFDQNWA